MRDRPAISPGDLTSAFNRLQPGNDRTRDLIAEALGVGWVAAAPEPPPPPPEPPEIEPPPIESMAPMPPPAPTPEAREAPPGVAALSRVIDARLTPIRTLSREAPAWLDRVPPLPRPSSTGAAAEPEPLLDPQRSRSILSAGLSTSAGEGEIDLRAVVAAIARGEALSDVPRLPIPTLALGVQVLLDRSEAMLPFAADQRQIVAAMETVAGGDRLQVLSFAGCPSRRAGSGLRRRWSGYFTDHLPARGTRVVCVTDLGLGRPASGALPASEDEWLDYHRRLRVAGCPLLILIPYHPVRWPPALARRLGLLHWSRAANSAQAARAARR